MIVLDTNVISALLQSTADPTVVDWLDAQPTESVWTTCVCVFEVLYGLKIMTTGKRRRALQDAFEQALQQDIPGLRGDRKTVFPFDRMAASGGR